MTQERCEGLVPMGKNVVVAPESLIDSTTELPPHHIPERMHGASRWTQWSGTIMLPPTYLPGRANSSTAFVLYCFHFKCLPLFAAPPQANEEPRHVSVPASRRRRRFARYTYNMINYSSSKQTRGMKEKKR